MLVLSRKSNESLILKTEQGDIEIIMLKTNGVRTSIGIRAPEEIKVYRKETLAKK